MKVEIMDSFVYLLRCADDSLYCGWTNDIKARIAAHKSGHGAKYTRAHKVEELVYLEKCEDKSAALRREAQIKKLPREQKIALCKEHATETAALTVEYDIYE